MESIYSVAVNSGSSVPLQFNLSRNQPGIYHVYVSGADAGSFRVEEVVDSSIVLMLSISLIIVALGLAVIYIKRKQQGYY